MRNLTNAAVNGEMFVKLIFAIRDRLFSMRQRRRSAKMFARINEFC
jgi:hypothetical protein